jgi:hypothetical protein
MACGRRSAPDKCCGDTDHRAKRHSFVLCIANLANYRSPRLFSGALVTPAKPRATAYIRLAALGIGPGLAEVERPAGRER